MSNKWYSIGWWDQPLLFTSWDSEFSASDVGRRLSPGLEGGLKVKSREFFFNQRDIDYFKKRVGQKSFLEQYIKSHRQVMGDFVRLMKRYSYPKVTNNKQALEIFSQFVAANRELAYFVNSGWPVERALTPILIKEIDQQTILELVKAEKKVDVHRENLGLQRLRRGLIKKFGRSFNTLNARAVLRRLPKESRLYRELQRHASRYSYLPMHTFRGQPWTLVNYIERAQALGAQKPAVYKKFSVPKKILFSSQRFIKNLKTLNELRQERIEYINKWVWVLEPLWQYCQRQLKITRAEFINLTYREVIRALPSGRLPVSRRELRLRDRAYSSVWDKGRFTYHSSRPAQQTKLETKTKVLQGFAASPGKAIGKVRVVRGVADFAAFKKGEILVATHTTPNFVAIMTKAGAIVTDLGGITSHAAVVSRELNVPCVIDTKIATKVFKDGDRVEVDAERGTVRKLYD